MTRFDILFFSRPSPKAGRELQTVSDTRMMNDGGTLSGAGAGHRAVSLHRGCVLVYLGLDNLNVLLDSIIVPNGI